MLPRRSACFAIRPDYITQISVFATTPTTLTYQRSQVRVLSRPDEYLHGAVKQALEFAVHRAELTRNPAKLAMLPKLSDEAEADDDDLGPVRSLTEEQEQRFLQAALPDRLAALWCLLLDAGLQPGEAFTRKW